MAGLPGTGLGGIFYALLVLFVVAREAVLTYRRRSSVARRSLTMRMLGLVALMGGVLWVEGYVVMLVIGWFNDAFASSSISPREMSGLLPPAVPEIAPAPMSEMAPELMPHSLPVPVFQPLPEAIVPALAFTPLIFLGAVLAAVQILRQFVLRQMRSSGSRE